MSDIFYDNLTAEEQISYLFKPILQVLKDNGGQLTRSEIKKKICELDDHIAEFEQKIYTSSQTGNQYKKFDLKFNFAIKELSFVNLISYIKDDPLITLTAKGSDVDLKSFDAKAEVTEKAKKFWNELSVKNKKKKLQKLILKNNWCL